MTNDGSNQTAFGDGSKQTAGGDGSNQAASGNGSNQAASGNGSKQAASGNDSNQAACGDGSRQAACGNFSKQSLDGLDCVAVAAGSGARVRASKPAWVALASYDAKGNPDGFASGKLGEGGLKLDTWYRAEAGVLVECDQ